jgi:hypothetical protein
MPEFKKPNFKDKDLELRFENNEVCIYGTKEGFQKLSDLILNLVAKPKQGHIHLKDYNLLAKDSFEGVIAIFEKS